MMMRDREKRREAGTLLFRALVPTILFGDILFGSRTLYYRDVTLYHYPGKHVLREIVLGGEFPYWSPYISAGQPLAANPVHQVFYPLTWLILLPDFTTGFNLLALVHIFSGSSECMRCCARCAPAARPRHSELSRTASAACSCRC